MQTNYDVQVDTEKKTHDIIRASVLQWRSYVQSLGSADPDKFVKNQCKSLFITVFHR